MRDTLKADAATASNEAITTRCCGVIPPVVAGTLARYYGELFNVRPELIRTSVVANNFRCCGTMSGRVAQPVTVRHIPTTRRDVKPEEEEYSLSSSSSSPPPFVIMHY